MIKKIILTLALIAMPFTICFGDSLNVGEIVKKLPELKQGVAYSFIDEEFNYISTLEVAKYKDLNLELGYNSKDKIVIAVSYPLVELKDYIDLPILNLLKCNIGVYAGYGRLGITEGNNEFDWGFSMTILEIKW